MFGQNEIVGRRFFRRTDAVELLVTSIFYTLQGEGPLAGRPAIFVRLAKCNLACSFCDTFFDKGTMMDYQQILTVAETILPEGIQLKSLALVITGGEPSLQENVADFIETVRHKFAVVQVESNGLLYLPLRMGTILVVSPKCAELNGRPNHYLKPPDHVLHRATCFKFLLTADPDSPYHTVPDWALLNRGANVYVSPMNEYLAYPEKGALHQGELADRAKAEVVSFWEPGLLDLRKVRRNHEYAAQYCLKHGTRLTLQMQLFASLP